MTMSPKCSQGPCFFCYESFSDFIIKTLDGYFLHFKQCSTNFHIICWYILSFTVCHSRVYHCTKIHLTCSIGIRNGFSSKNEVNSLFLAKTMCSSVFLIDSPLHAFIMGEKIAQRKRGGRKIIGYLGTGHVL